MSAFNLGSTRFITTSFKEWPSDIIVDCFIITQDKQEAINWQMRYMKMQLITHFPA